MKKNVKAIIISLVLFLLFVLLIVIYILQNRIVPVPAGTVGNTAGNANNGGMFCEYNGVVYFSNPYDGGALYSMSPDESNIKKLISANVSHLNAGGRYLFYYQSGNSGSAGLGYLRSSHGLCRATLNGRDITNLSKELVFHVQLIGNYLYYLTSTEEGPFFYKLRTDKQEKELLANTGWNFACALADGSVYYNGTETNHYLYRYHTASDTSDVAWAGNLWYPVYDNGYIYYLDVAENYRLCRYSLSGDMVEVLTHDRVDCFNLAGGYIYYQKNSTDEPALKRMALDGSNVETVASGNYTHINATSRYVYFTAFESEAPVYRTPVSGPVSVSTFEAAREAAARNIK